MTPGTLGIFQKRKTLHDHKVCWSNLFTAKGPDRSRVSSIQSSIKIWYSLLAPPTSRVCCPCTSTPDPWWAVVQVTGPVLLRGRSIPDRGNSRNIEFWGNFPAHSHIFDICNMLVWRHIRIALDLFFPKHTLKDASNNLDPNKILLQVNFFFSSEI